MVQPFSAPSHHDVLVLLVQLSILLFTARLLGALAQRFGQPTVIGEIGAGILLGPSFLSGLVPALGGWIVPQTPTQGYLLETVSLIGVLFLLLITGLETDLPLIRRQARSALGVAAGGLIVPLLMGFGLGWVLPDSLLVDVERRFIFAAFLATALAISAIPVLAKVLMDLNLTRRNIGQTVIAAAMIDDTTGWILLSVVVGLASGASLSFLGVVQSVVVVLAFIGLTLTLGRRLVRWLFRFVQNEIEGRAKFLSLSVLLMFVWGAIAQEIGLEALLGAFVIGIVLGQMPALPSETVHTLEDVTLAIFAPMFFAVAGLKVNIATLLTPELLFITLVLILVATLSKLLGVYVGARYLAGIDHWTAIFYGAGLNARGSMGIIIATIGLTLGMLSQAMFSMIVLMSVVTSLIAPFILRYALPNIPIDVEEVERLKREASARENVIQNVRRVLLPLRPRPDAGTVQTVEVVLLARLAKHKSDLQTTLMTVSSVAQRDESTRALNQMAGAFSGLSVGKRVAVGEAADEAILNEARRGYELMLVGASEGITSTDVLFTPIVDYLVRLAPCPVVVVRAPNVAPDWKPSRILIPTNGSNASLRAAELAYGLATEGDETLFFLRVVEYAEPSPTDVSGTLVLRQMKTAWQSVDELMALGNGRVTTERQVLVGKAPEEEILHYAEAQSIDLIILGTSVGAGERLYLGPRVERILKRATCPVLVINT